MDAVLKLTETHETYTVTDAENLRDASRCEFQPEEATIIHRGIPWFIEIKGRRVKSGRYTRTGYRINEDGSIEPHYRFGPPPNWVADLVKRSDPTRLGPSHLGGF